MEKLELLDNKIKNKKYPFEKNTWWTLLSENICDHKINNIEKKDVFYFKRIEDLKKNISEENIEKIKKHFGNITFKKIIFFNKKNWENFKVRLVKDLESNNY